jgi:hypothetical protein
MIRRVRVVFILYYILLFFVSPPTSSPRQSTPSLKNSLTHLHVHTQTHTHMHAYRYPHKVWYNVQQLLTYDSPLLFSSYSSSRPESWYIRVVLMLLQSSSSSSLLLLALFFIYFFFFYLRSILLICFSRLYSSPPHSCTPGTHNATTTAWLYIPW